MIFCCFLVRATDAAVALAEKIGGTQEYFVELMNKRANELGLKDTLFQNSHGIDEDNHYSSAYDMGIIAKELLKHAHDSLYRQCHNARLME